MTDSTSDRSHTSSSAVLGALLHVAARTLDLSSGVGTRGPVKELNRHDREIIAAVGLSLRSMFATDQRALDRTLAEVASALRFVRNRDETPSLTAARYDAGREELLRHLGAQSVKGASIWPPTSQTAVQRFGSWNKALKAAGLATSSVGRARGQLRFDAAAYDKAIAEFVSDCESRGSGATYKAYTEYAADHKGEVPSAAAVRKFYGSWNKALASVGL